MVIGKLAKRGISMKSVEQCEPDISPLGHARQVIKIKQGIESAVAKEITGFIRDGKFKVTTQIQGDEVRVNSKSRDELQTVIAAVRAKEFPVAVQFVNFRDLFNWLRAEIEPTMDKGDFLFASFNDREIREIGH
jgi:cyclic-di-GMP-binding protein